MTKSKINQFHQILEARVIEFSSSTRRRDAIVIHKSAEELESRLQAVERELAVRTLESASAKLRETEAALLRIKDGTFGICLECEEPIHPRRLAALPWAALCIRCQEEMDCRCGYHHARPTLAMAA